VRRPEQTAARWVTRLEMWMNEQNTTPLYPFLHVCGIQIHGPPLSSAYTCCYWELLNEQLLYTECVDRRGGASRLEMPRRDSNARTLRSTLADVLECRTALLNKWTCYNRGCYSNWNILVQKISALLKDVAGRRKLVLLKQLVTFRTSICERMQERESI
jgi:hypothetical protein